LHALKSWDDAILAYEQGLAVAPGDAGLQSGLAEVQKMKEASRARPAAGGPGNLFGPQFLSKLAGHPKYGPKLADPAFVQKLSMIQSNPQLLMSDPELMEVLQIMIGGSEGGDEDDYQPPSSQSRPAPTQEAPKPPPAPVDPFANMTEEEKAEKQKKLNAIAAKDRGNGLYKEKKFAEALAAYDEAVAIDPSNVMFLNNKAAVYIEMGDLEKALALCDEALELGKVHRSSYEDKAKVYQRIASVHLKKNDLQAAINAYQKSQMEVFDKNIERKIKNLQLDLRKQEQEQYVNPELAVEAKERGNAAFRDGKFPEAIKEYEEAVKRHPSNPAYRNNLAAAYLKMGLFNDAKREIDKCLEMDKTYVKAWAKKGDIEFFMKEYHKALDSYQAGLQLEPDNSLCKDGIRKTMEKIQTSNGPDSERQAHAMVSSSHSFKYSGN
jgi:stress-induced-phosphoprotein 1